MYLKYIYVFVHDFREKANCFLDFFFPLDSLLDAVHYF